MAIIMKKTYRTIAILFLCLSWGAATYASLNFAKNDQLKSFKAEKKWLRIPVENGAPKRHVEISNDGEKVRWFSVELAEGQADWYAYLDISAWKGENLEIHVDTVTNAFETITQTDHDNNAGKLYAEEYRGQFHFSPKRGWNNDPNGMVYYKGQYHLFFQHNPYGVDWGNMHWGHAVSNDLVHWKELDIALYPDENGTMFSGGGLVDEANSSGLGNRKDPPMLLFYTAAEKTWDQGLAWTTDGKQFSKLDQTVVKKITDGNRDPKVIWHEPSQRWVMVLYVEEQGGLHTMHFFTSVDLKAWEPASVYTGGRGNDRYMFECPEFFELEVEGGNGQKKWVLTGANSAYAIGTFDGKKFTPEIERLNGNFGRDFYAAQTFSNEPKGRRIEMGWWRTHTKDKGMIFNQSMSIPMEIKLVQTNDGPRMTRTPVRELQKLRGRSHKISGTKIKQGDGNPLHGVQADLAEIRLELEPGTAREITLSVRGMELTYTPGKEELTIDGLRAPVKALDGRLNLTVYVDRTGIEIFADKGLVFIPVNKNLETSNSSFSFSVNGGESNIRSLEL
jgi:fructan beta-fructosidase